VNDEVRRVPAVDTNADRRENVRDEIVLGVLDVVEKDSAVTQRSVASELGIAVGLANAYLKRCIRKGLIRVRQIPPRRYSYYLTPQGFAEKSRLTASYLAHSFSFFRQARSQCAMLFAEAAGRGQRRLGLVGKGDLAEIASLVIREFQLDIAGIIDAQTDPQVLKAATNALGEVDAMMITTLVQSRETYAAAVEIFGTNRVHAPALLRVGLTVVEEKP
jgi:DNA-binding transcriptional regulator LsrR (DeoR family)